MRIYFGSWFGLVGAQAGAFARVSVLAGLILVAGCPVAGGAGMDRAFDAFYLAHGELTGDTCPEDLPYQVTVTYVNQSTLQTKCGTSVPVDGCSFGAAKQIWVLNGAGDDVLAHEWLHQVLYCELGYGDSSHLDSAWKWL